MRPAITDPALIERLSLDDERFYDHFLALVVNFPPRDWTQEAFERALRYPWYRPERSYLLRDRHAALLHELDASERAAALERHAARVPLLAIGGNASPKYLSLKLAHHEEAEDREVLVLAGELHELDVVACAAVSIYGAMPATLAASPGAAVRAGVLMVTPAQLTTLAWGEIPYRVGRLRGAPFVVEDGVEGLEIEAPLAFVSRWGAFAPDGDAAPLAAIPARGRAGRGWTQRELLDRAAEIVLGPGNAAEDLTRLPCELGGSAAARIIPALRPHAQPFDFAGWTPMAPDGTWPRGR